jgi:hypothetical protein
MSEMDASQQNAYLSFTRKLAHSGTVFPSPLSSSVDRVTMEEQIWTSIRHPIRMGRSVGLPRPPPSPATFKKLKSSDSELKISFPFIPEVIDRELKRVLASFLTNRPA